MNVREIEYVLRIAEEKSITKAAEKLFLTPSALTQQLLRLEEDLGTPLFFRSRTGCTPTPAGEIYLDAGKQMLHTRREAYDKIRDLANIKKGTLAIGLPPEHGPEMFLSVYPVFHKRYPEVAIYMREVGTKRQQEMIAGGSLDFGFMNVMESQMTKDEYQPLVTEELLAMVPAGHPAAEHAVPGSFLPELDLHFLNHEIFVLPSRESTLRKWIDEQMRAAGCTPNVLFENTQGRTMLQMVVRGLCCGMASDFYYHPEVKNISYCSLPNHPVWFFCASYRKGSYLSAPAKEFIRLAADYWKEQRRRTGLTV